MNLKLAKTFRGLAQLSNIYVLNITVKRKQFKNNFVSADFSSLTATLTYFNILQVLFKAF